MGQAQAGRQDQAVSRLRDLLDQVLHCHHAHHCFHHIDDDDDDQEGSRGREERLKLKERERRVQELEGRWDTTTIIIIVVSGVNI